MKKIVFILCALMASCLEARDINTKPIELKCIRFNYAFPGRGEFPVDYCFDTEHALCYASVGFESFQVVDFRNCYDLFTEYIDQSKAEKEP